MQSMNQDGYGKMATQFYDLAKKFASTDEVYYYHNLLKPISGRVLEAMCGSGRLLIPLRKLGIDIEGLDSSSEMLASCRSRADKESVTVQVRLHDILEPLKNKYEAIIIAAASFQLLTDDKSITKFLKNIRLALREGGQLIIDISQENYATKKLSKQVSLSENEAIVMQANIAKVASAYQFEITYTHYIKNHVQSVEHQVMAYRSYDVEELKSLFENNGFFDISIDAVSFKDLPGERLILKAKSKQPAPVVKATTVFSKPEEDKTMYKDLSSEYYELTAVSPEKEVAYFDARLKNAKQPILEGMAGNGRILIPLLERGHKIEGLDFSEPMLKLCRQKAKAKKFSVTLYHQSIAEPLAKQYGTIYIPFRSFQLLTDLKLAILTIINLNNHLLMGGELLIDHNYPTKLFFKKDNSGIDEQIGTCPDGAIIKHQNEFTVDMDNQTCHYQSKFIKLRNGAIEETEHEELSLRWYCDTQINYLFETLGFDVSFEQPEVDKFYNDKPKTICLRKARTVEAKDNIVDTLIDELGALWQVELAKYHSQSKHNTLTS